jgi:hypothetical protein
MMKIDNVNTGFVRAAAFCAVAFVLCGAPSAWAQEKQKISYKVTAENSKYTQRNTIDVGDESGHQLVIFEIHRTFPANAPMINGVKLKELWTRGYADYVNNNGISSNYGVYSLENGDKFYTFSSTMGQADAAGKRTTVSVGSIRGGTGKLAGMKGMLRLTGVSDGKSGFNESQAEIEYWFAK